MIKKVVYSFGKKNANNFVGRNAFRLGRVLTNIFAPAHYDSNLVFSTVVEITKPLDEKNDDGNPA